MELQHDVTNQESVASTIEAALLFYHEHMRSMLNKQSKSKGKQKVTDNTELHEDFESQLVILEACLPHTQVMSIAISRTRNLSPDIHHKVYNSSPTRLALKGTVIEDDVPFLNPLTGQLIYPDTPFTPGPSDVGLRNMPLQDEDQRVATLRSEIKGLQDQQKSSPEAETPRIFNTSSTSLDTKPIVSLSKAEGDLVVSQTAQSYMHNWLPNWSLSKSESLFDSISTYAQHILKAEDRQKPIAVSPKRTTSSNVSGEDMFAKDSTALLQGSAGSPHLYDIQHRHPLEGVLLPKNNSDETALAHQNLSYEASHPPPCEMLTFGALSSPHHRNSRQTVPRKPEPEPFKSKQQPEFNGILKCVKQTVVRDLPENKLNVLSIECGEFPLLHHEAEKEFIINPTRNSPNEDRILSDERHTKSNLQVRLDPSNPIEYRDSQIQPRHLPSHSVMVSDPTCDDQEEVVFKCLQADRAIALAIAGTVPQDLEAFNSIRRGEEAKLLAEQRLAQQLVEEQDKQQMDYQLEEARKLYQEWCGESEGIKEQAVYAQEIWNQERRELDDAEKSIALAHKLLAEWELEDSTFQEQEAFAKRVWEQENENADQMKSSIALAQKLQAEWNNSSEVDYQLPGTYPPDPTSIQPQSLSGMSRENLVQKTPGPFLSKDLPPPYSPMASKAATVQGENRRDREPEAVFQALIPENHRQEVSFEGFPDAIQTFSSEMQRQYYEAERIQRECKKHVQKESQAWETRREKHRKQELEEWQRSENLLGAQKEARKREARQIEEERARLEAQQQALEDAKRKQEREAECAACKDSYDRDSMVILMWCKHAYCRNCVRQCFSHALRARKPFLCCKTRVPLGEVSAFLDASFVLSYQALTIELDTPNPLYCHEPTCAVFIPPSCIRADVGTCSTCKRDTCKLCKKKQHSGVCEEDREGTELLKTAKKKNWQTCPKCKMMVDRRSGCLHMTCVCGQHFCYNCGEDYSRCPGTCQRRY